MKSHLTILLICLLTCPLVFSQTKTTKGLDRALFNKLIYQQFGNLINPQSNNNIGNYASLDLKEAEVNFSGNIMFNNGSILGIKATGAVTDGLLPVFSNSKLNSKLSLDVQYNFLALKKRKILYDNSSYEKYEDAKRKLQHTYDLSKIEILNNQKKIILQLEIEKLKKKDTIMQTKLVKLINLQKDSMQIEILKVKDEITYKTAELNNLKTEQDLLFELENWRATEMKKLDSELKIYGFKIGWFSVGYGLKNQSFRLFDASMPYNSQVTKGTYLSHFIRAQYSFYNKTPVAYNSYFLSIGVTFALEDNLSTLSKVEINETDQYGPDSNARIINTKFNAYKGSYQNNLKSFSVYSDMYWFLFNGNKGAIHFYPEFRIMDNVNPSANLGFGFLLTFKGKEKAENIVNSEVYINLLDISNSNTSSENLLNRSSYGLRFTIPINFNSK